MLCIRRALEKEAETAAFAAARVAERAEMLRASGRCKREGLGDVEKIYTAFKPEEVPAEFQFTPGEKCTTRGS